MSKITVTIAEDFVKQQINELVQKNTSQNVLTKIVREQITDQLKAYYEEVTPYLTEKIFQSVEKDLTVQRDCIIESYLEGKRTQIFLNTELKATVEGATTHKELRKLITLLQLFKQALIVGPTGSGKSTLASQAAKALNLPFGSYSCNMEASKADLIGFMSAGGERYVESNFLYFYENGGVFLVDEYDAMSPSISVVLNAVFDRSGQIAIPNRTSKPIAVKHPDFYCVLAGNTWGTGSIEYQGRDMQDAAFLDRFKMCRIFIDYDANIEKSIAGEHYNWFIKIRKFIEDHLETEKFSTRSIYDATLLLKNKVGKGKLKEMISLHWDSNIRDQFIRHI